MCGCLSAAVGIHAQEAHQSTSLGVTLLHLHDKALFWPSLRACPIDDFLDVNCVTQPVLIAVPHNVLQRDARRRGRSATEVDAVDRLVDLPLGVPGVDPFDYHPNQPRAAGTAPCMPDVRLRLHAAVGSGMTLRRGVPRAGVGGPGVSGGLGPASTLGRQPACTLAHRVLVGEPCRDAWSAGSHLPILAFCGRQCTAAAKRPSRGCHRLRRRAVTKAGW